MVIKPTRLNMDTEKGLDVSSLDDRDESQETPEDESDDVGVLVRNEIEDAKEQDQDALERQMGRRRCNPSCKSPAYCVRGMCCTEMFGNVFKNDSILNCTKL